jgi:hypothetical protein
MSSEKDKIDPINEGLPEISNEANIQETFGLVGPIDQDKKRIIDYRPSAFSVPNLKKLNLTANQFLYLTLISKKDYNSLKEMIVLENNMDKFIDDLYEIYRKDYVDLNPEVFIVDLHKITEYIETVKVNQTFSKSITKTVKEVSPTFDEFFVKWYDLFPVGIFSGGYSLRSNRVATKERLLKFYTKHNFSLEIIYQATEYYINKFKETEYKFMKTSLYFIEKDKNSTLLDYCEDIQRRIENKENIQNVIENKPKVVIPFGQKKV